MRMEGVLGLLAGQAVIVDPASTPAALCYKILIGSVAPRPIAFVSSLSPTGVRNLAPFSFFNAVCGEPPVIAFSTSFREPRKDTLVNIRATGDFVVNIVSEDIAEQMNLCSGEYPPDTDEFAISGLTPIASEVVRAPRVKESRVNMECRLLQTINVSTRPGGGTLILGEVVRFHVDDAIINPAYHIDADELRPIGRMGGNDYARTSDRFSLVRPGGRA
jgi:flavin reductase (DIM6/NTAB) family NADH-FMN oxidoreductase RutF